MMLNLGTVTLFLRPGDRHEFAPVCGVFILAAALATAAPQNPPARPDPRTSQPTASQAATAPATGRIRGRVVRADTGAPLFGAQITLEGEPRVPRRTTTDEEGRYEFTELPAGRFLLDAAQGGYVTLQYGQRRAFETGRPLMLADAQLLEKIDFALPRGGVIVGRITDESGEPVTGAQIRVKRHQYGPGGQRQLAAFPLGAAINPFALMTNDRGEFRVFGLSPGDYVVGARLQSMALPLVPGAASDAPEEFLPTYYPGTVNAAEAQTITVGISQEVPVHFAMVPGRNVRISGTVVDSNGRPAAGVNLSVLSMTATTASFGNGGSVAADGSFSIGNVPPGEYYLQVRPQLGPDGESATVSIAVGTENLAGVLISTTRGTTTTGTVEWDGNAPRAMGTDENPLRIRAIAADLRPALLAASPTVDPEVDGTVRDDDSFALGGINGQVTFRPMALSAAWTLKAVLANGKDITDLGADAASLGGDTRIRVIFTDKVTELSGSVRNTRGEPVSDYVVIVLPQQMTDGVAGTRFTRTVRPDQAGSFRTRALPPGRYVAAAIDGLEQGREWDPQVQKTIRAAGQSFTLGEGEALTLTMTLLP
jgi:hypothetical protein